jgi:hypothetical protein
MTSVFGEQTAQDCEELVSSSLAPTPRRALIGVLFRDLIAVRPPFAKAVRCLGFVVEISAQNPGQ